MPVGCAGATGAIAVGTVTAGVLELVPTTRLLSRTLVTGLLRLVTEDARLDTETRVLTEVETGCPDTLTICVCMMVCVKQTPFAQLRSRGALFTALEVRLSMKRFSG